MCDIGTTVVGLLQILYRHLKEMTKVWHLSPLKPFS